MALRSFSCVVFVMFSGIITGCDSQNERLPSNVYEEAVYSDSRFNNDEKSDKFRAPASILEFSGVKEGMVVADLSAGTGYYTELLSHVVGSTGKVYLHNKPKYFAREKKKAVIDKRLDNQRLQNVSLVSSELDNLSLPSSVDLVFVSKIFHDLYLAKNGEIPNPKAEAFINQISQYLKPNGQVLLIEHSAIIGSNASETHKLHRIDEIFVKQVFEQNGFELVSSSEVLRNPSDNRVLSIWDGSINKKTDRFVYLFRKK